MAKDKLEAYLESLDSADADLENCDYAILFPGIISRPRHNNDREEWDRIASLIATSIPNIEDEIRLYFDVTNDEEESVNAQPSNSGANAGENAQLNDATTSRENTELVTRWCKLLEEPTIDATQLNEILKLDDATFGAVLKCCSDTMSIPLLEKITFHAWKLAATVPRNHVRHLAEFGLLPKMIKADVPLRTVFPVFQKLVAMDTSITTEYILLPMIQRKVVIPRPLLNGIDKQLFLSVVLRWMEGSAVELSPDLVNILIPLLEGQRKMDEVCITTIIKLSSQAMTLRPSDKSLAFFLRTFIDVTANVLKPEHLKALTDMNRFNQTDLKTSIDALIHKIDENNLI